MTTTIEIRTPSLRDAVRAAAADWGPALHSAARSVAAVLVAVYTAGLVAGLRWRRLLAWIDQHHHQGLARLGLPGAGLDPRRWPSIDLPLLPVAEVAAMETREWEAFFPSPGREPEPEQQPDAASECRRLRSQGLGLGSIARRTGLSRRAVQRELAS